MVRLLLSRVVCEAVEVWLVGKWSLRVLSQYLSGTVQAG